jgi:hypothetical protein
MELEEFVGLYRKGNNEDDVRLRRDLVILYNGLRHSGLAATLTRDQAESILNGCGMFKDYGYDLGNEDTTYQNLQARIRNM